MHEEYWITKEGKKIAVADMNEHYLRNVLRKLLRERKSIALAVDCNFEGMKKSIRKILNVK